MWRDDFMEVFIILIIIVAAVIIIRYVLKQKEITNRKISDNEYYRKRQESAIWGTGLIVHSDGGSLPFTSSKIPVALTLEITTIDGKPYRAKTEWLVDLTALSYVAQGQELAVKIDKDDKSKIYPNASWAKYISP
jgi:hypothetical protein